MSLHRDLEVYERELAKAKKAVKDYSELVKATREKIVTLEDKLEKK